MKIHLFIADSHEGTSLLKWMWRTTPTRHDPIYVWVKRVGGSRSSQWLRISEPLGYHGTVGRPLRVKLRNGKWRLVIARQSPGSTNGRAALSNELQFLVEKEDARV